MNDIFFDYNITLNEKYRKEFNEECDVLRYLDVILSTHHKKNIVAPEKDIFSSLFDHQELCGSDREDNESKLTLTYTANASNVSPKATPTNNNEKEKEEGGVEFGFEEAYIPTLQLMQYYTNNELSRLNNNYFSANSNTSLSTQGDGSLSLSYEHFNMYNNNNPNQNNNNARNSLQPLYGDFNEGEYDSAEYIRPVDAALASQATGNFYRPVY
ncbi:hypothetical protein ADEAN_000267000 [Angomonas deanei]|uniref:Uncharacterized protein n=1 Tax=Angomonas deanei TaxID=59799 RepID=A0A7G2C6W6_9TRYP|nr:hypothetical protein ADEAN_000267000 [Angomonas deanei]